MKLLLAAALIGSVAAQNVFDQDTDSGTVLFLLVLQHTTHAIVEASLFRFWLTDLSLYCVSANV